MMEAHVLRLLWALPLVAVVGGLLIWMLKRLGVDQRFAPLALEPEVLRTTPISQNTRLIEVVHQGTTYIVFESDVHIQVQHPPVHQGGPSWSNLMRRR